MAIFVSDDGRAYLQQLISSGNYPAAYLYLRDVVQSSDYFPDTRTSRLAKWLDSAAHINANDGGFVSEYVRGATFEMARQYDVPMSEELFQKASNAMARDIVSGVIDTGVVPPIEQIMNRDMSVAETQFDLPKWGWGGTFADSIPLIMGGFGKDFSYVPDDDPNKWQDRGKVFAGFFAGMWRSKFSDYGQMPNAIPEYFVEAGAWVDSRDPLALDLDGNGISTISASAGITFDHNKSGIEYGTGWINPADGWLALDRNGNGQIDSGRELFGENTIKLDGNHAAHAYDALKSFDTNNDGKVDAADATGDSNGNGVIDGTETYWDTTRTAQYALMDQLLCAA